MRHVSGLRFFGYGVHDYDISRLLDGRHKALRQLSFRLSRDFDLNPSTRGNIRREKIWINLELAKKPPECLRYVLIHELGHFVSRKHDAAFIAYMDKYMPEWRNVRQELNRQPLETFERHTEENGRA